MTTDADFSPGNNAVGQAFASGAREVPAMMVPVPDTVSRQMQMLIGAPLSPTWNVIPNTVEEWKAQVDASAAAIMSGLPALREALGVRVEPMTIDGVKAHRVTPQAVPRKTGTGCWFMSMGAASRAFPANPERSKRS